MKFPILAAAVALAFTGTAAPALAQQEVTAGTTIYGSDGAEIGTIESVDGPNVVLNTGSVTAALPADGIVAGDNGPTINITKAELEAAVNQANQAAADQLAAALVEGAEVYSADDVRLGTIKSVEDEVVVVELAGGPASLPKNQLALQSEKVTFLATAAALEAAVAAQGGD